MSRSTHTSIADQIATLDPQQRAAVESDEPVQHVIAGPGSGKTTTLVTRIQARVAAGIDPARMAVMTFTNAGANEFCRRLSPIVPGYSGTLHGFCLRLLQAHGHLIGYRRGGISINVLSEQEVDVLVEQARNALGLKAKVTMKALRDFQANMIGCGEEAARNLQLVWSAYLDTLKRNNMIDYDRILTEGLKLIRLGAVSSGLKIDELFIDEAQDHSATDWEIVDAIPAKWKFVVGDPDQSLYSWRGAAPGLLVERAKRGTIKLELNYRSGSNICRVANALIQHNENRVAKDTIAATPADGRVSPVEECVDDIEEIGMIAGWLRNKANVIPWAEMAVLTRTNALANKIRAGLRSFSIPVAMPPRTEEPDGWRRALLLCAIAADPSNNLYAERLLSTILPKPQLDKFKRDADINRQSLAQWYNLQAPTSLVDLPRFMARFKVPYASIDIVTARIGEIQRPTTMVEFVHDLYLSESFGSAPVASREAVEVMTIHAAKGREWTAVHIAGLEEGTLPSLRSDIEEERRLLFVAITRARRRLSFSWARRRTGDRHWETRDGLLPSRFIEEFSK